MLKGGGGEMGAGCGGGGVVLRAGYLKKLKTHRRKWFVLRGEGAEAAARLDYYDTEKKWHAGQPPKRSIPLRTCFNINRRADIKHRHVIALYTKDDCFCMVLDSEEELDGWLKALLSLQQGEEAVDGETPRPTFEHVWQVTVLTRGLGGSSFGSNSKHQESAIYRLCLTDKTLSLIRKDQDTPQVELSLSSIRSCGNLKSYFFLEVGRSSVTGAGELWMETEDSNIAQNVYHTVYRAMLTSSSSKEELGPKSRNRSSSATEASKPNAARKPSSKYHHNQDPSPQVQDTQIATNPTAVGKTTGVAGRERCDSMPSRARTSSEGTHPLHTTWAQPRATLTPHRPQSLYARDISRSPPAGSPVSPPSVACSTDSAGSSLSIDDAEQWNETDNMIVRYTLTPDEAIAEENYDECPDSPYGTQGTSPTGYVPMAPISSDDGYVDMSPKGRHATMSPAASTSSVTSGTPSTDMRFAEYQLEKVSAYFTPSEEDASSVERPARAYSVGSRADAIKSKMRFDMASTPENSRVRAFSVGSKSRRVPTRVLPPHGCVTVHSKSNSAPLLSATRQLSSLSCDDPMNDLMEMDFSRPATTPTTASNNAAYMNMNHHHSGNNNKVPNAGYVEMRPGHHHSDTFPYVDMRSGAGSSPVTHNDDFLSGARKPNARREAKEYVEMDRRGSARHGTSDYIDMNFQSRAHRNGRRQVEEEPTNDSSLDYMDMDMAGQGARITCEPSPTVSEGYVEMSLGRSGHQRQSSLDGGRGAGTSDSNDDYTNMSAGSTARRKRGSKKEKTRSQPITIQTSAAQSQHASISPVYAPYMPIMGRQYASGTPPMYLPLAPPTSANSSSSNSYSSLPRQRTRNPKSSSRRGSKDSNSSSAVTTPSSSSTIFPFSLCSPSSPMKGAAVVARSPDTSSAIRVPPAVLSVKYERAQDKKEGDQKPATPPSGGGGGENASDYVNFNPAPPRLPTKYDASGDYALMQPGAHTASALAPKLLSQLSLADSMGFKPITDMDNAGKTTAATTTDDDDDYVMTGGFARAQKTRPSSVNSERIKKPERTRPASVTSEMTRGSSLALLSRPNSVSSEFSSSTSTVVGSRPNSVNSERIRPASVTIEGQLHYASLDLAPACEEEGGGSKSPRMPKTQQQQPVVGGKETTASTSVVSGTTASCVNNACTSATCDTPTNVSPTHAQADVQPTFTYAEIDFYKSEGLKLNAKVKH